MGITKHGGKLSLVLILQTAFFFFGIYIFTRGFLLKRVVVPQNSKCSDVISNSTFFHAHDVFQEFGSCWRTARFKKAVLIVIDALRYDFMLYNESLETKDALSFQNKLEIINEVLKTRSGHGRIFKFVADPPTTTMQRIKGLTTGSLPTFIDAGSNFASSEIHEDNIITQLKRRGKRIVFMGDDTWMGLFPNHFDRHYPYPSFNVKDLHTVDNGVISHLIPEIRKPDWDVIIAHFLGVDHCGHRYGPYHPAMAEKLTQMDQVLSSVVNELDNETILMVFGDHGMTKSGDHGGDSDDEVHAGLFVYSPSKLFSDTQREEDQVVSQSDFVPTFSLLLGQPIPYSNLGIIVPSLFENSGSEILPKNISILHALELNVRQVDRYVSEYTKLSNDISSQALDAIKQSVFKKEIVIDELMQNFPKFGDDISQGEKADYLSFLKQIRKLCREVWAKFDVPAIQTGIFAMAVSCMVSLLLVFVPDLLLNGDLSRNLNNFGKAVALVIVPGMVLFQGYVSLFFLLFLLYGIAGILFKMHSRIFAFKKDYFDHIKLKEYATVFVLCAQFIIFFSNSYVVNEDKILVFFLQTILLVLVVDILTNAVAAVKVLEIENTKGYRIQNRKDKKKRGAIWAALGKHRRELACLFALMGSFRLSSLFSHCREEQKACELAEFLKTSFNDSKQNGYHVWLASLFLLLIPASVIFRLRTDGNLNGYSCSVLAVKYALPFGALFACVHWLLQYVPARMMDENPVIGVFQQIITPCILYICCLGVLCCLLYQPITAFVVQSSDLNSEPSISTREQAMRNSVVQIFRQLRSEMSEPDDAKDIPYVYGLGTVYSSAVLILLTCFALPVAVVLGDSLGPSVTLMLAQMYLFLELNRMMSSQEANSQCSLLVPVMTWMTMASHNFYSTGHQATFPAIRFEAAFVGLPGDMNSFYLPGFLILLNTFASDVLFTIALPLIILWRKQSINSETIDDNNRSLTGELIYHENPTTLRSDMFRSFVLYQVCKGFRLLGTMSAAAVHRRHLMVWKIFAPRFIFEGVSFIVMSIFLILMFGFVLRVDQSFNSWCLALQRRSDRSFKS
ncbi:GPI ethanolamine phosphate transferase 3-like [Dendronephthya gigantea]|uniref:GPI ethanolamine phosphate transferase 3-like n=1 Tax=Dendronephthya gigantea TaxID=151771 RepID=UPI001069E701|nr:GPI ethanolamine phosphate transferase 3-like [Dendronephthya gigantea]